MEKTNMELGGGLPLSLRLGLSTAALVVIILGVLTAYQEYRDIHQEWNDRDLLLKEALAPLKIELEQCHTTHEMIKKVQQFQMAYARWGYSDYRLELRDSSGTLLISAPSNFSDAPPIKPYSTTAIISSPLLTDQTGEITVWQDASKFRYEIERRWIFWILDLLLTGFFIILSLMIINHFQFTKPLKRLLDGIRKLKLGYRGKIDIRHGAREIQWLATNFNQMMSESEETIKRLVEAERRALQLLNDQDCGGMKKDGDAQKKDSWSHPLKPPDTTGEEPPSERLKLIEEYLWDKCHLLEKLDPTLSSTQDLALEVWQQDALNAGRLGLHNLKATLEDIAFHILNPTESDKLQAKISHRISSVHPRISEIIETLHKNLETLQIPVNAIQWRIKHTAGVWRKMQTKGIEMEELTDLIALRVIVPEERHCYMTLNIVHRIFEPDLLRFKDYIAKPKLNGYQSIHTSVCSTEDVCFEVQIRTQKMHTFAENGTASHWRYRELNNILPRPKRHVMKRLAAAIGSRNGL